MKKLTLLRHAKAGEDEPVTRDLDRRLNAKGRRAARAMGRHLRETGARFDSTLASPALRVAETVAEVQAGYGRGIEPSVDRRLYLAPADDLIEVLRERPESDASVLLVAHNPGLEDLVLALVADPDDRGRSQVSEKYPTASVAEIELAIEDWASLSAGDGRLIRFVRPRDIDPTLGPDAE